MVDIELKLLYIKILKLGCEVSSMREANGTYYITLGSDTRPYRTIILTPTV